MLRFRRLKWVFIIGLWVLVILAVIVANVLTGFGSQGTWRHLAYLLGYLAVLTFIMLASFRRADHEALCRQASVCPDCGYSLTGNQSGRCPECGKEVPQGP
jgi:hypothetical protein